MIPCSGQACLEVFDSISNFVCKSSPKRPKLIGIAAVNDGRREPTG